uniref:O-acyltransferase n=1 Tax=Denticeps clupeoides TaxID=299321 RepID=A0AAY4EU98_9TELE
MISVNWMKIVFADKYTGLETEDLRQWRQHVEQLKAELLQEVQGHLSYLLDRAITQSIESLSLLSSQWAHKPDDGKVFTARQSLLDELFEIPHIRTIYHMFIAALLLFIFSTMAVNFIDQGRLVPEFDLFIYAFGKLSVVAWTWFIMFTYTLLGPYGALCVWGELYHSSRYKIMVSVTATLILAAIHVLVLGFFPLYAVLHHQLPPVSRFIITMEQIRFLMKSYSFIRESVPSVIKNAPQIPTLSSYLYFLFAPTLIYRESYPRNSHIRWNVVISNLLKVLGSTFYLNFILVRLCIPVFQNEGNKSFTTRTLVLSMFHAILPGILMMLLGFYGFLHCWLNAFAELLRFADRMFYKDWWNSTSFANYFRTWNVVVHDWLFYYGYRDVLWLTGRKSRSAAMLWVFGLSAVAHEYAMTMCFGFFYPVMFCLFAVFGMVFNFALNDKRQSHVWNIIMWTCLMLGQGMQVCLYCQEWYAQIHCTSFWELVTPRSWTCIYE